MGIRVAALLVAPTRAVGLHWPIFASGLGIDPNRARSAALVDDLCLLLPPPIDVDFDELPPGFAEADFLPAGASFLGLTLSRSGHAWLLGASETAGASWAARFESGALVAAETTGDGRVSYGPDGLERDEAWSGDPLSAADSCAAQLPGGAETLDDLLALL